MVDTVITGKSLIAGKSVTGESGELRAIDPRTGHELDPIVTLLSRDQLHAATAAARDAFGSYRALSPQSRAAFLDTIAHNLEEMRAQIVERAGLETGLTSARLEGELTRTTNQLRLFGEVVRRGDHLGVRIDEGGAGGTTRPDLRQRKIPVGPVVVFGASNFPLAFSTAGGDTASALAAGCPVIVKGHNAHPGTGELAGRAITNAVAAHDLDPGVFSLVFGPGEEVGVTLVTDPAVAAVAFTGSRRGGTALMAHAAARPMPIPVYAEMSSINPVVVLPGRLAESSDDLAAGYVTSLTGSGGQLCTAPGLLFVPQGEEGNTFVEQVSALVGETGGHTMLTPQIADAYVTGSARMAQHQEATTVAEGHPGDTLNAPAAQVVSVDMTRFVEDSDLQEEVFGAFGLVIRYGSIEELLAAVRGLEGQLTATLQMSAGDLDAARQLLPELEVKVGRVIVNGWPTGVDVGHAVVHGGPFPATSDPRTTSVGTAAVDRFLRPVAYQDLPQELLPPEVRDDNPLQLVRMVNGQVRIDPRP